MGRRWREEVNLDDGEFIARVEVGCCPHCRCGPDDEYETPVRVFIKLVAGAGFEPTTAFGL